MTDARPQGVDEATFLAAARSGDTARFALLTERHRRGLQVHCYRMLANYEDAHRPMSSFGMRTTTTGSPASAAHMRASHTYSELLVATAGELIQVAGAAASHAIDRTLHAEELTVPDHGDEPLPRLHPASPLINTTP